MACWRETWLPGNGMVLSGVRPIVAVLLTSRSKGSPPGALTRNVAGISVAMMARRGVVDQRQSWDMFDVPAPIQGAPIRVTSAHFLSVCYKNQLTSRTQSPRLRPHSIKSGGGTGPAMPRQPVLRNAERPGANSSSEEFFGQRWRERRLCNSRDSWWDATKYRPALIYG